MNNKVIYTLVVAVIVITGCKSGRVSTTEMKPGEAIIIARIRILNHNQDITTESTLLFNERLRGKYAVIPDDKGYIYAKLPVGKNHLTYLSYKNYYKNLPPENIVVTIPEQNKLYYIGDIEIVCDFTRKDVSATGAAGVIAQSKKDGAKLKISIKNNFEYDTSYFKQKIKTDKEILINIAEVNTF